MQRLAITPILRQLVLCGHSVCLRIFPACFAVRFWLSGPLRVIPASHASLEGYSNQLEVALTVLGREVNCVNSGL